MNFPEQHVAALKKYGYTERESQFLYLVATFSGEFIRRQLTDFIGNQGRGGREVSFLKKAIDQGHIQELSYRQANRRRYHLAAHSIYAAIHKEHSAHRKPSNRNRMMLRLRMLDFVLDNFNEDYLEEEADKVNFFTQQKGIALDLLPFTTYANKRTMPGTDRYFPDEFPLFITNEASPSAIPVFTYFEGQHERATDFPTHLNWYKPLLQALDGQYKLIYVANNEYRFECAEKSFHAVLSNPQQVLAPSLLKYFRLRSLWDSKKFGQLKDQDLATLNKLEKRYSRPQHERIYGRWIRTQQGETSTLATPSIADRCGIFETYLLNL